MTIDVEPFDEINGHPVHRYTLRGPDGLTARLTNYGARLVEMHVPDRDGALADVTLGHDDLAPYVTGDHYFGATCGRYGNRIRKSCFLLDGQEVRVTPNEGPHQCHGGPNGFDRQVWQAQIDEGASAVTFTYLSPDGDQGFPGAVLLLARYQLAGDRLIITMRGTTDAPTVLNVVNHAYWNMAGQGSGDIRDQNLSVAADFTTPVDDALLATGEVLAVAGTPFDFRRPKPIGQDLDALPRFEVGHLSGGGYDHNWVLHDQGPGLRAVATLWDPASGRGLELRATEPGVQIYTGGYMTPAMIGKGGRPYAAYGGLTFETQKWPCSPNLAHFPSARLDPGQVYEHRMEYRFFAR